jgi:hypothetical protein
MLSLLMLATSPDQHPLRVKAHLAPPPTFSPLLIAKSRRIRTYANPTYNPFTMNTSKTKDLKSFRIRTYKKTGEGAPPTGQELHRRAATRKVCPPTAQIPHTPLASSAERRSFPSAHYSLFIARSPARHGFRHFTTRLTKRGASFNVKCLSDT